MGKVTRVRYETMQRASGEAKFVNETFMNTDGPVSSDPPSLDFCTHVSGIEAWKVDKLCFSSRDFTMPLSSSWVA